MRQQDYAIDATREAMAEAFRYARAVPEEKLDWKPMDAGQSVLSMMRELAICPDWACEVFEGKGAEGINNQEQRNEMRSWATLDDCEAACHVKLERYFGIIREFPDAKLTDTMDLPFGPSGSMKSFTVAELLEFTRWNATYHLGQIGYIQKLYGDHEMH